MATTCIHMHSSLLKFASIALIFCNICKNWTLLHNIWAIAEKLKYQDLFVFLHLYRSQLDHIQIFSANLSIVISILVVLRNRISKNDQTIKFSKFQTKISQEGEYVWFLFENISTNYSERIGNICLQCCLLLQFLYVGYRMFFHDRARGEAECEIVKKTFYDVGYILVWLLTYFQIFFKTESSSFSEKLDSNFT